MLHFILLFYSYVFLTIRNKLDLSYWTVLLFEQKALVEIVSTCNVCRQQQNTLFKLYIYPLSIFYCSFTELMIYSNELLGTGQFLQWSPSFILQEPFSTYVTNLCRQGVFELHIYNPLDQGSITMCQWPMKVTSSQEKYNRG